MNKNLLIILVVCFSINLFSMNLSTNWSKMQSMTNSFADEPVKIIIEKDSNSNCDSIFAVFEALSGKMEFFNDTVFADKNGIIENQVKIGKSMGDYIFKADVYNGTTLIKSFNYKVIGLNIIEIIIILLGGLGLFLFGMKYMSDGLQNISGDTFRNIIAKVTKNTFFGVLTGVVITSIIQSSSATTVMVVGLVNAGIMTLKQSIGIIMGANIGTTMTAQLIAFKFETVALPCISIGVLMLLFARKQKLKLFGETLFGFGLLFFGITMMSNAITPIKDSPKLIEFFITFSKSPILAMLAGMVITMVIQSSSATVGLTMVLAAQGLIDIYAAVPLVLGENIGTTVTALLAALSSNRNGKRAAIIHSLFNVIGVTYMMVGFYFVKIDGVPAYLKLIDWMTPGRNLAGENIARYIANSHTTFNVFNAIVFLPFAGVLKFIAEKIIPETKTVEKRTTTTKYLDKNLLVNPHIALFHVRKEMQHMLDTAKDSIDLATEVLTENKTENIDKVKKLEIKTDMLQNEITTYLISISKEHLTDEEFSQIPVYIHSINDIERIGDHSMNLLEFAQMLREGKIDFSKVAFENIKKMNSVLLKMMEQANAAIEDMSEERVREIFVMEDNLNEYEREFNKEHLLRLNQNTCNNESAALFTDILSSYERCGDHIMNIAQAINNKYQWRSK
ncbi:MAG: Na/Pi cotransporter family protein [bacterium]